MRSLTSSASAALAVSLIGVRITTGGMGREPGMLIRIRVVSVVSVFGSSGPAAASGASWPADDGVPYGGVPEGYPAAPRPWRPEDELSVSRLKAGSLPIGSATRSRSCGPSGRAARRRAPPYWPPSFRTGRAGEGAPRPPLLRRRARARHLPSRADGPPGGANPPIVAQITAATMPPSRKT
ncbi:hypothetical protein DT019_23835 [Streptomyces sp. SDr-06]|nr:hypothetical protein DT019_23835 [Streptomyces sp. SDr-06]